MTGYYLYWSTVFIVTLLVAGLFIKKLDEILKELRKRNNDKH